MTTRVEIALAAIRKAMTAVQADYREEIFQQEPSSEGDEARRHIATKMEVTNDVMSRLEIVLKEEDL